MSINLGIFSLSLRIVPIGSRPFLREYCASALNYVKKAGEGNVAIREIHIFTIYHTVEAKRVLLN